MNKITVEQTQAIMEKKAFLRNMIASLRLKKDKISRDMKNVVERAGDIKEKGDFAKTMRLPSGERTIMFNVKDGNEAQAYKLGVDALNMELPVAADLPTKAHELAEIANMAHPVRTKGSFYPATMYALPAFATEPLFKAVDYFAKGDNGAVGRFLDRRIGTFLRNIDPRPNEKASPFVRELMQRLDGKIRFRDDNGRVVFGNMIGSHMSPDVYVAEALAASNLRFPENMKAMFENALMRHVSGEGPLFRKALAHPELVTNYDLNTRQILSLLRIKSVIDPTSGRMYANTRTGLLS